MSGFHRFAGRAPISALVAVLVARLFDEGATFLPAGTLESFRTDLALSYTEASVVLVALAPGAIFGNVFAAMADHRSRRVIASGGAFGFAAALALFASGDTLWTLVAASVFAGAATTAMVDAGEVALVDLVERAGGDLRRTLARANLWAVVGDLTGPALVAGVAFAGWSWRVAFWVGAGALAGYGLVLAAAPLPAPAPRSDDDQPRGWMTAREVARDPRVWVIGLLSTLAGPFDEDFLGFTIAMLERVRDASTGAATVVALVAVSGGLVTFTVLASWARTVSDDRLLVIGIVSMTAGAVGVAASPRVVLVAAAAFVVSVGLNLSWLALQHRTLTLRPAQVGTTKAVVSTIEFSGFVIPLGIGVVADAHGLVTALAAFGVLGSVMLVATVALGRDGRHAAR